MYIYARTTPLYVLEFHYKNVFFFQINFNISIQTNKSDKCSIYNLRSLINAIVIDPSYVFFAERKFVYPCLVCVLAKL